MDVIRQSYKLAKSLNEQYSDIVELEARIKGPIISKYSTMRLISKYDINSWIITKYKEKRNKIVGVQSAIYRSINDSEIIRKTKINSTKLPNDWLSIVISTEQELIDMTFMGKYYTNTIKVRYSRKLDDYTRLDITHILDSDTYQVEIEVLNLTKSSPDIFQQHIMNVINHLQDSPIYINRKRFELIRNIANKETNGFCIGKHKYQKPVTLTPLKLPRIFKSPTDTIYMTPKIDGVRRFLIIFNSMIYVIDTNLHVRLLSTSCSYTDYKITIIDTEYSNQIYYVIDIVVYKGKDIKNLKTLNRLAFAKEFLNDYLFPIIEIKMKENLKIKKDLEFIKNFYNKYKSISDGLIFFNDNHDYMHKVIKWKEFVTIDLFISQKDDNQKTMILNSGNHILQYNSLIINENIYQGEGVYELLICSEPPTNNDLQYTIFSEPTQNSLGNYKIIRYRYDKEKPNSWKTITNNIEEGVKLTGMLNGVSSYFMRKYHNKIKSHMIKSIKSYENILDIGTGQGGDLNKWKNSSIVYCVEPNQEAIDEFMKRLKNNAKNIKPKIIRIQEKTKNYKEIINKINDSIDLITIFFALNMFDTNDIKGLIKIIDEIPKSNNCKIIGIYMDENYIKDGHNSCYNITHINEREYQIKLFNTRINQIEYNLNIDKLKIPLENIGFKLIKHNQLIPENDVLMSNDERKLSSMFSSFVFDFQR